MLVNDLDSSCLDLGIVLDNPEELVTSEHGIQEAPLRSSPEASSSLVSSERENPVASPLIETSVVADEDTLTGNATCENSCEGREWKNLKRKRLREMGKSFECNGKERDSKVLKEPCACKSAKMHCSDFSLSDRQSIFDHIWSLTWKEKAAYINGLVDKHQPDRRRVSSENPRKTSTLRYHLKKDGTNLQVCRVMFLNTTALGDWFVRNACTGDISSLQSQPVKRKPQYDRAQADKKFLIHEFFNQLAKMPSHYCRQRTDKIYLETSFTSYSEIHREYAAKCRASGRKELGIKVFCEVFRQQNLALHQPRKDQCDLCVGYKEGNVEEEAWKTHMAEKDTAQAEKSGDKHQAQMNPESICVLCMDLQAVLLAPSLKASALYYKTKLCLHNFTVYDLNTKDVQCYVWHEGEGGLTANEFSSCIVDFLRTKSGFDKIIIFSDGCPYQNRNSVLANAIRHFSMETGVTVEQKYLVKGHTYMEVDSTHSLIERALKNKLIYVPMDYINIFRSARVNPRPFDVKYLDHSFFLDYTHTGPYRSIRPGRGKGDPTVTDIRALRYTNDGNICYKLKFDCEWTELPKPRSHVANETQQLQPKRLYHQSLKITENKYRHLQQLKAVIPRDHHTFYDELSH